MTLNQIFHLGLGAQRLLALRLQSSLPSTGERSTLPMVIGFLLLALLLFLLMRYLKKKSG